MSEWIKKAAKPLLAVLLLSQFYSVAHAIEHGAEPHSHGEIDCPLVFGNDDTPAVTLSSEPFQALLIDQRTESFVQSAQCLSREVLLPPATGPPSKS